MLNNISNSGDQMMHDIHAALVLGSPTDHASHENHPCVVGRAPTIASIIDTHRQNRAAINSKNRVNSAMQARVRGALGFDPFGPASERKEVERRASLILAFAEQKVRRNRSEAEYKADMAQFEIVRELRELQGSAVPKKPKLKYREPKEPVVLDATDAALHDMLYPLIAASWESMIPLERLIAQSEKILADLVASLPIAEFISRRHGIGLPGAGAILGEARYDLSLYPNHQHLWKRLGLASLDGYAQGKFGKKTPTAEDWASHGYNPQRRSIVRSCVGTPLMLSGEKNAYRAEYDAYKARITEKNEQGGFADRAAEEAKRRKKRAEETGENIARVPDGQLSKSHINNMALRYMEKMFIKDLWQAWHAADRAALGVPA